MDSIDLSDYVAGGYFVAKPIRREDWMSAELLPEQLITLSSCLNKSKVQIYWGWDTDQYKTEIQDSGIKESDLEALRTWSQSENIGHPNVFYSLNAAQDFITKFTPHNDFSVFGIALPKELVSNFLAENQQTIYYPATQTTKPVIDGINLVLSQNKTLEPHGNILGFEIVSSVYSDLAHSWLCNGIEKDMFEQFSIRPNQYGLINSYLEAKQIYDWIAEDELRGTRSEPEPYYPWLIVQYPIT